LDARGGYSGRNSSDDHAKQSASQKAEKVRPNIDALSPTAEHPEQSERCGHRQPSAPAAKGSPPSSNHD
jgi:hypothetical protein